MRVKLRQGMRRSQCPPAEQPVEQTIEQVFGRLNRRPRLAVVWGGAAIFIGALSSGREFISPQLAQSPRLHKVNH